MDCAPCGRQASELPLDRLFALIGRRSSPARPAAQYGIRKSGARRIVGDEVWMALRRGESQTLLHGHRVHRFQVGAHGKALVAHLGGSEMESRWTTSLAPPESGNDARVVASL